MPKWREREREREKTFILALPETNAGEVPGGGWPTAERDGDDRR
jgi:hypothetical protein